jgi:serine/threonine-protein phosphatase 2B regulatory subunit
MSLSELDKHPLGHRIARIFTLDSNELIDFKEFARTLSIFSDNRQRDKKVQFYFRIFDMDMDGFVSGTDMFVILTMLVGQNMSNDQI